MTNEFERRFARHRDELEWLFIWSCMTIGTLYCVLKR